MKDILRKLNYIFNSKQKRQMAALLLAIFFGAMLELIGVSLIMPVIQLISDPSSVYTNEYLRALFEATHAGSAQEFLICLILLIIVIYAAKNIYLSVMYYFQYSYIYNNQLLVAGRLVDCYLKKPYVYHLDHNTSDMIRNIMLDTDRLFQLILQVLNVTAEALLSCLLGLYLLISDPLMTLTVGFLLGISMVVLRGLTKKRVHRYGQINQEFDGRMHQSIDEALGAVKDIKILHREGYFVDSFISCGKKKMNALINTNFFGQIPKYLIESVCIAAIMIVLVIKLKSGTDLKTILPQLSAFAVAAFKLLPSVGKISNYLNGITFLRPSIDLIYRDLKDTADMLHYRVSDKSSEKLPDNGNIYVDHLSFSYPGAESKVLNDVSFEIPSGSAVGFIGKSGAGKSTMADLILGILTPSEGRVLYGGMNVHESPLNWSKKLAYIPQSIYLADRSVRANIAFGVPEEKIEDDKVWEALNEAQLKDFVESLPQGLDTSVGERGVRLSGGQRQRIGIARALYGSPEILVLDEATSALDNDTEKAVMEAIDSLHGKKTLIIIAHRLSTIENCDLVFKVEDGKVIRSRQA
ncbi:MAG: ABC transporter ATP-binding protein [Lachnospiraceae bacterium]|nr:ABC transporter ATP-binding protein [Lachnospiraceae bacterium]